MRKLFLAAAGVFIAASAQADTPPATTAAAPATPVVADGTYVATSQPRRGLFSRLRNRANRSTPATYSAPMTTTVTPAAPGGMPAPTPTPMPMGKVSSAPMATPASGVVQTSGTSPMTTTGTVTTAAATMPMTTSTRPMRMGFIRSMFYR